ncbi:MAG: flippase [Gemmatimonadaceae bacterium]
MTATDDITAALRSRVGRNALLNLTGLAVPLSIAVLLLPVLTRALGPARFGLLGISWAFLEYLTLFDVGLGKATVRYVADAIARETHDVPQITAVSVAVQLALGAVAALALALAAPVLAQRVFKVDPGLIPEASRLFVVVGLNLPAVLALTTLRGVLEGAQKFAVSNAIKIPATAGAIVIPTIVVVQGYSLPTALVWVFAWRIVACLATLIAIVRVVPDFRIEMPRDWRRLRGLIGFGGWVAISGVVSPILVYFDRFALGARSGLTAVGYYTAPYEGVTRLLMIPNSLINALFPLITGLGVAAAAAHIDRLFTSSMRTLILLMTVPAAIALFFAPMILRFWMGPEYAAHGEIALRILALGVLINAVAHIPYTFLEVSGRPDVPAKFHLLELAIHLPFAWFMVGRFGINGAAIAWTARVTLDTLLLLVAASRIVPVSLRAVFTGHYPLAPTRSTA